MSSPQVTVIKWLSREAGEAEVWLRADGRELRAYCHPCELHEGDCVREPLLVFDSGQIMKSSRDSEDFIPSAHGYFAYQVFCRVSDAKRRLVSVGEITLRLDLPLPGDIQNGDVVEFVCNRIDVLR